MFDILFIKMSTLMLLGVLSLFKTWGEGGRDGHIYN